MIPMQLNLLVIVVVLMVTQVVCAFIDYPPSGPSEFEMYFDKYLKGKKLTFGLPGGTRIIERKQDNGDPVLSIQKIDTGEEFDYHFQFFSNFLIKHSNPESLRPTTLRNQTIGIVPFGRSLQKNFTTLSHPRFVSTFDPSHKLPNHPLSVFPSIRNDVIFDDQIAFSFIGYSSQKKQAEILSIDPNSGQFATLIVDNFGPNLEPKLTFPERSKCLKCHQHNGAPILTTTPWREFDLRTINDKRKARNLPPFPVFGAPFSELSYDNTTHGILMLGMDLRVRRANSISGSYRHLAQICKNSLMCRRLALAVSYDTPGERVQEDDYHRILRNTSLVWQAKLPEWENLSNGYPSSYLIDTRDFYGDNIEKSVSVFADDINRFLNNKSFGVQVLRDYFNLLPGDLTGIVEQYKGDIEGKKRSEIWMPGETARRMLDPRTERFKRRLSEGETVLTHFETETSNQMFFHSSKAHLVDFLQNNGVPDPTNQHSRFRRVSYILQSNDIGRYLSENWPPKDNNWMKLLADGLNSSSEIRLLKTKKEFWSFLIEYGRKEDIDWVNSRVTQELIYNEPSEEKDSTQNLSWEQVSKLAEDSNTSPQVFNEMAQKYCLSCHSPNLIFTLAPTWPTVMKDGEEHVDLSRLGDLYSVNNKKGLVEYMLMSRQMPEPNSSAIREMRKDAKKLGITVDVLRAIMADSFRKMLQNSN